MQPLLALLLTVSPLGAPQDGAGSDGAGSNGVTSDGASLESSAAAVDTATVGSSALGLGAPDAALDGVLAVRADLGVDEPDGQEDLGGTSLSDAIVVLRGTAHGYRFELGLDLDTADGSSLERAWVEDSLDERHRVRFGIVRDPFLYSAFADEDAFVFPYRSRLGRAFERTDAGLELLADYGRADLRLAFTNGGDGLGRSRSGTLRLGFHLFGDDVAPGERPRAGADGAHLFLAYTDDGSTDRADAFAGELYAQSGRYRGAFEFVDAGPGLDDQRGWSAVLSGSFDQGETEVAVRAESIRRPTRRSAYGVAVTQSVYHDLLRLQAAVEWVDGSASDSDGLQLSAGVILTL